MSAQQSFLEAVQKGETARVRELLAAEPGLAGARSGAGISALLLAVYRGRKEMVEVLLEKRSEFDIFEASAIGMMDQVEALVMRDPSPVNVFSVDGFTPLHLAAYLGHPAIVEFLIDKGADVNAVAKNKMRVMPLHSALARRHTRIAQLLLDKGAQVNAKQEHGYTPLHEAAANGDADIVQALIDRGADVNAKLDSGQTAVALALERGHQEIANLLRQHGGNG